MLATTKELQSQLEHVKYSRDVVHSYSNGVKKLFDLAVSYVFDAEKANKEGKSVVWSWGIWEAPFLYACDTIPVSFTELGRLGSHEAMSIAEDYYQIPREACSMVKSTLGEWHLRKGGINRILGSCAACEPYNLATELIKAQGYEVYDLDTVYRPPQSTPEHFEEIVKFFIGEIHGVGRWLTGKNVDEARMSLEIKRRNGFMQKIRTIMELRLKHPLYIRSLPTMFMLMGSGHYFGKPEEYSEVLEQLVEELQSLPDESEDAQKVIPLVWAGGRGQEFGVYQAIDEAGGAILGWVIPTPFAKDYREDLPPVEALARYYLEGQTAGATIFKQRVVEEQIKKTNARGLIQYGYVGCSFSGIDREMQREYFQKKGIPSISLEGTFQVGPPTGQILTRVRAFVEMLS
ncbi:MAG TPA: 2-hydroxyacyl-CoA dehydratase family protein [Negativicutes bacterium]|nr:2-hydroxyacyl-CoA dehydratase family protein [Negativicutes bacterium]